MFVVSFFLLFTIIGIPIMLNPNRGQSANLYKENIKELNKYIDEFLERKANEIDRQINILNRNIAVNPNLGESALNKIIDDLNNNVEKYNENQGLYYENQKRIILLNKYIEKLEREIERLELELSSLRSSLSNEKSRPEPDKSAISSYKRQIAKCQQKIQKLNADLEKAKARLAQAKVLINKLTNTLYDLKELINNIDKKYLNFLGSNGSYNYFVHKVAGFENGFDKNKFKEVIKKQIDTVFLMEVNTLIRPDTKINNEYVTVRYKNGKMSINSKQVIDEVLNEYMSHITYNEFIVNEKNNILFYDRTITVFDKMTDEKAENPIYKSFKLKPIPYFYVNQIHNYYVVNNYVTVIKNILDKQNGYIKKITERDGMSKDDVIKYFKDNMQENWLLGIADDDNINEKHFDNIENIVKQREPQGRNEILSRADYFMKAFNNSSLSYFPGKNLEGKFISEFTNNIRIEIPDYLLAVEKNIISEIKSKINGEYIIISDGENNIWDLSNDIRINQTIPSIDSKKDKINKIGNILSGNIALGIGDKGFMQHILDDKNLTYKELYLNSIPIYSRAELKPGDLALYYNPISKTEDNIFGVYAGNGNFYHFNLYKLYEKDKNVTAEGVDMIKGEGNFNLFMRYYPIK